MHGSVGGSTYRFFGRSLLVAAVLTLGVGTSGGCSSPGGDSPVETERDAGGADVEERRDANAGVDGGGGGSCPEGRRCSGQCVDTTSNDRHCGGCENRCRRSGAEADCRAGECRGWRCKSAWLNTDGDLSNGCELECSGESYQRGGVLDVDLETVEVTGTLRRNGDIPAELSEWTGSLTFRNLKTGATRSLEVDRRAGETSLAFEVRVFPGDYEVTYSTAQGCDAEGRGAACGTQTLVDSVALTQSQTLDLDVDYTTQPVDVSGSIRVDGGPIEGDGSAGRIVFSSESGYTASADIETGGGSGTYDVELIAGTYDISIQPDDRCDSADPLPCQAYPLEEGERIRSSGRLDFDLPIVEVSGAVTVDGAQPGASPDGTDRAHAVFSRSEGGAVVDSLGASGSAEYDVELYAGTYDISLTHPGQSDCRAAPQSQPFPCWTHVVERDVSLTNSGSLAIDVSVVDVSGALTFDGQPAGRNLDRTWGSIVFANDRGEATVEIGTDDAGSYETRLYAGEYDVTVEHPDDCPAEPDASPLPCQSVTTDRGATIETSGEFDVDVSVVEIQGAVTMNGDDLPRRGRGDRGKLVFVRRGDAASAEGERPTEVTWIDEGSEATYSVRLYPGRYDVFYARSACRKGDELPCQRGRLQEKVALNSGGKLDLDLPAVRVQGTVKVDGEPMGEPVAGLERGRMVFDRIGADGSSADSQVATAGRATYEVTLFTGSYRVDFQGLDCPDDETKTGIVPCMSGVVAGCE